MMSDCKKCWRPILPPSPILTYENKSYHPECLICSVCKLTLKGKQFYKEKNDSLVCNDCYRINGPKCSKCKFTFLPGQSYKKLNEREFYHFECFKCSGPCCAPIGTEYYEIEKGMFMCGSCYNKCGKDYAKNQDKLGVKKEICKKCSRQILPPSPILTYESKSFHPECLTCSVCKISLSDKKFVKEKNDSLICIECYRIKGPKCTKCKITFSPGQTYKRLSEHELYHIECFQCCGPCRKAIGTEYYDIDSGKFLCENCYNKYGVDYQKYMSSSVKSSNNDKYERPAQAAPSAPPHPATAITLKRTVSLSDIKSESDIANLTIKQMKEILEFNCIEVKDCFEKRELVEKLRVLSGLDNSSVNQVSQGGPSSSSLTTIADDKDKDVCKICMDSVIDCVLLDCGHMCSCLDCSKNLIQCPICRKNIVKITKVFKS